MTRLNEIGLLIGKLYIERAQATLEEWGAEKLIDARVLEITPPEGWPGKNEEQRSLAKQRAMAEDGQMIEYSKAADQAHVLISDKDAQIAALEAERRSLEWSIRADLVQALMRSNVQSSGGQVEETAFDDAQQAQVDQAAFPPADFPF